MTDRNFAAIGWGLFFIWIGICYIAGFDFTIGLLGIGVIILGLQLARMFLHIKYEVFWVIVSILFILGGIWNLFKVEFDLVPILIIIAGALLLVSAFTGKKSIEQHQQ